jgi:DNA-binding NtrC family response regulator
MQGPIAGRAALRQARVFYGTFSLFEMMDVRSSRLPDDVLVVEDDGIIALDCEDTLLGFGVKMVRTVGSVTRSLKMIDERAPDFALLDISLVHEKSFAIAERLDELGVPFAFVSGYGVDFGLPAAFANKPRLSKPWSADALKSLLRSAMAGRPKP